MFIIEANAWLATAAKGSKYVGIRRFHLWQLKVR